MFSDRSREKKHMGVCVYVYIFFTLLPHWYYLATYYVCIILICNYKCNGVENVKLTWKALALVLLLPFSWTMELLKLECIETTIFHIGSGFVLILILSQHTKWLTPKLFGRAKEFSKLCFQVVTFLYMLVASIMMRDLIKRKNLFKIYRNILKELLCNWSITLSFRCVVFHVNPLQFHSFGGKLQELETSFCHCILSLITFLI